MHDTPHAYALAHEGELFTIYAYSQEQAEEVLKGSELPSELPLRDMGERAEGPPMYTHPTRGNVEATQVLSRENALQLWSPEDAE